MGNGEVNTGLPEVRDSVGIIADRMDEKISHDLDTLYRVVRQLSGDVEAREHLDGAQPSDIAAKGRAILELLQQPVTVQRD